MPPKSSELRLVSDISAWLAAGKENLKFQSRQGHKYHHVTDSFINVYHY